MSQTAHAETTGLQRLTRKGQATRDRIVEAAAGLMFRQGVAGTTIEQVQEAPASVLPRFSTTSATSVPWSGP